MRICYFNAGLFIGISLILPFIPFENVNWQVFSPLFFVCGLTIICVPSIIASRTTMLLSPVEEQRDLASSIYVKAIKTNKILAGFCIAFGIAVPFLLSDKMQDCLGGSMILIIGGLLMVSMPEIASRLLVKLVRFVSQNHARGKRAKM